MKEDLPKTNSQNAASDTGQELLELQLESGGVVQKQTFSSCLDLCLDIILLENLCSKLKDHSKTLKHKAAQNVLCVGVIQDAKHFLTLLYIAVLLFSQERF